METSPASMTFPVKNHPDNAVFRSTDGRFGLVINSNNLDRLHSHCAAAHPLETGGVLIGYYNAKHDTAIITCATAPPPDSQSGQTQLRRGTQKLNEMLGRLWRKHEYYLGEWHYHPGGLARPTATDARQMLEIAKDYDAHCPEPILVIVGANRTITAHVFTIDKLSIELKYASTT